MLSTTQRRAILWRLYDLTTTLGGASTYATLLIAVQAIATATVSITATGTVEMVSGNGKSIKFGTASTSATPEDYCENAASFRDLYEDSKAALISSGIVAPTDPQIFAEMKFRLVPIAEVGELDITALRCA